MHDINTYGKFDIHLCLFKSGEGGPEEVISFDGIWIGFVEIRFGEDF